MEGGIGYGLSAALSSEITLVDGEVQQSNFHDYLVSRIDQMPEVEVHTVTSAEALSPNTGEFRTALVFVAALGASSYTYAES